MTGLYQRHRSSLRICNGLLVGMVILWAETVTAQEASPTYNYASYEDSTTTIVPELLSSTDLTPTMDRNKTIHAPTDAISTKTEMTPSQANPTTNMASTSISERLTRQDGETSGPGEDNKESATERIGSVSVAGLILVIVGLLLVAVNGYVFFKPRMGSCGSKSGMFHVLPMSAIKKNRSNDSDAENDVEDNFKEEDDITSVEIKDGPADQATGQNGKVHVKVDVTDIAGPSTDITGPSTDIARTSTDIDDGEEAKESLDNDDAASSPVVDESEKPEEEVEKSDETVVTVEGGIDHQDEQA